MAFFLVLLSEYRISRGRIQSPYFVVILVGLLSCQGDTDTSGVEAFECRLKIDLQLNIISFRLVEMCTPRQDDIPKKAIDSLKLRVEQTLDEPVFQVAASLREARKTPDEIDIAVRREETGREAPVESGRCPRTGNSYPSRFEKRLLPRLLQDPSTASLRSFSSSFMDFR